MGGYYPDGFIEDSDDVEQRYDVYCRFGENKGVIAYIDRGGFIELDESPSYCSDKKRLGGLFENKDVDEKTSKKKKFKKKSNFGKLKIKKSSVKKKK